MNTNIAKLLYEMEKGHDTMLVTILSDQGSTPRGVGSQMLVGEAGRLVGTIGGGAVERRSEELAGSFLAEKKSAIHEFRLHRNETEDIGMVCGGDVVVQFQYISGTDEGWRTLAERLMAQVAERRSGKLALRKNGELAALFGEQDELLAGKAVTETDVAEENVVFLPLPVGERAVIFGGGHCAYALAPLLKTVGFRVTVMDCRKEFADAERFPDADAVICGDYLNLADSVTLTEEDYVVIMTNGHLHDYEVEEQVLRGSFAYLGVIGSRTKTASINARLREAGIPEERIACVHTPIGTAIKAVTPEEIAVSIAGEMIYERALRREAGKEVHYGCPVH